MTVEEAVQYCKVNELTVEFGANGVMVKDEGYYRISFWDTDFVDAVIQMRDYLEED